MVVSSFFQSTHRGRTIGLSEPPPRTIGHSNLLEKEHKLAGPGGSPAVVESTQYRRKHVLELWLKGNDEDSPQKIFDDNFPDNLFLCFR